MTRLFLPLFRAILGLLFLSHFMLHRRRDMHEVGRSLSSHKNDQTRPRTQAYVEASFSERSISALQQCRLPEVSQDDVLLGYHTARIDPNNSIGFRHITKTGSTTLTQYTALIRQRNHQTSPEDGIVYHAQHFDGVRMVFVRDPVDRFVSSYMEIRTPSRGYKPHYDDIQQDFDEFLVRYIEGKYSNGRYTITNHFRAQTAFLTHRNGDGIAFDYIGRAEHLNREWNTSLRSFLPFRIPDLPEKRGRSTTVVKPVMSSDQIRHVCRLYCHDICCLGMDFPPECTNSTGRERLDVCPCQSKRPPLYPWHTSS